MSILLCTRNGAAHLQAQLDSLVAQDHRDWSLWVSDDGSDDATPEILHRFRAERAGTNPVHLLSGPGRGAAQNFLSLICHPGLPAGPVALCDQDDVWLPHKLSRALGQLRQIGPGPVIYGAQTLHVDAALRPIGGSRRPVTGPSFRNALTQNIVSGHSTVLSPEALALARKAGAPAQIAHHDWWLYQLITGAGGRALIDDACVLLYRQHSGNTMGSHQGHRAALGRIGLVLGRRYRGWMQANLEALAASGLLTDENSRLVQAVQAIGPSWGPRRVAALRDLGLHRQTGSGTALFLTAAFLGRA